MNAVRCFGTRVLFGRVLTTKYTGVTIFGKRNIHRWIAPYLVEIARRKKGERPNPAFVRNAWLEWNHEAELYAFNMRLSEKFERDLLLRAFTFRSYIRQEEQKQRDVGIEDPKLDILDNTEMIEEGQSLTKKITESYLSRALPRAPKECIESLVDYLLSQRVMGNASFHLGTRDLILSDEYAPSEETLANTFYALVSALSRSPDVDEERVGLFVRDFLIACLSDKELAALWSPDDPERILNEILTRDNREIAEPRLIGQTGVASLLAAYHVAFYSNREFLGKAFGETIEEARTAAAIESLNRMFAISDSSKPIDFTLPVDPTSSSRNMENLPLTEWCTKNIAKIMHR